MSKIRKKYSPQEKAKIALEALKGESTTAQLSTKYGVHATQINAWCRQVKDGVVDIFRDKRRKDEADKDTLIDELYAEVGKKTHELEWLKKKSKLFD